LSDDEASESPLAAAVEVAGAALGGATWPGPSESPRATLSVEASDTPDEPYRETHFFSLSFGELNGERVTHSAAERYWPLRASRCARNAFESAKTWYAWTGDYVCVCVVQETRRDKQCLAAMTDGSSLLLFCVQVCESKCDSNHRSADQLSLNFLGCMTEQIQNIWASTRDAIKVSHSLDECQGGDA
jgi:hypothetical protein